MPTVRQFVDRRAPRRTRFGRATSRLAVLLGIALSVGCAAIHPIKGVPASYLPVEFLGPSRDGLRPINPMLLTRSRPGEHLVDAGDVLTIFIPGVLGTVSTDLHSIGEYPPINFPQDPEMPPTIGFPVTVRGDGTVSLPQVPPISVRGLTLAQAEEAVRHAYTYPKQILPAGQERVLVSLQRSREYRVLVVREDTAFTTEQSGFGTINLGQSRRGTARTVSLKAYENDVLHALSRGQGADGLPGLDAEGAVYVIRRRPRSGETGPAFGGAWDGGQGLPYGALPGDSLPGAQPPVMNSPVIRFQSPDGDYRHGGASAYGGHSIAAPQSMPQPSGRYAATTAVPSAGFAALPSMTTSSGRYGNYAATQSNGAAAATPAAGLSGGSGRYGAKSPPTLPTAAGNSAGRPMVTPTNWTTVTQRVPGSVNVPTQLAMSPMQQAAPAWEPSPGFAAPPQPFDPGSSPSAYGMQATPIQPQPAYTAPLPTAAPQSAPTQPFAPSMHAIAGPAPVPSPVQSFAVPGITPFGSAGHTGEVPHGAYFQSMIDAGLTGTIDDPHVVRIPIRVLPGETPQIRECDVTLEDGDIVFIEARDSEVFYTGGLLGGGQYTLPRDHDLHALEAVSIAQAQGSRGGNSRSSGGVSGLNQDVTISASKLIVVRKLADGTTVPIEIDLHRAKRDMTGRENIVIQPGDFLYLQYSCIEAVGAFFERHLLEGALFGVAAAQLNTNGN